MKFEWMFCTSLKRDQEEHRADVPAFMEWQERDMGHLLNDNCRSILVVEGVFGDCAWWKGSCKLQLSLLQAYSAYMIAEWPKFSPGRSARCLGITSSHRLNRQQLITGTPSQAKVAKVLDKVLQGHRPRCKQSYKVEPAFASRWARTRLKSQLNPISKTLRWHPYTQSVMCWKGQVFAWGSWWIQFVAHKLTGTIHVVQDEDVGRLACWRRKTINMTQVDPDAIDSATAPFCIQCNAVVKPQHA